MPIAIARRSALPLVAVALAAALASFGPGCAGSGPPDNGFVPEDSGVPDAPGDDATVAAPYDGSGGPPLGLSDAVSAGTLLIQPSDAVINVTIADGVITSGATTFTALADGVTPVTMVWSLDRSDLGVFDAHGSFTPSGRGAGVGMVTAKYGDVIASTTVTLSIKATQNGGGAGGSDGGVGGTGPGGPIDSTTQGLLQGPGVPPASAAELGWLYPYDKTVWPRGLMAPLLQWQTSHATSAVSIHLSQKYFDFQGFYSGTSLVNQPVDADAWYTATHSNTGDALHVEVKTYDGSAVHGPISEDWTIAPGVLTGTRTAATWDGPPSCPTERRSSSTAQ
jgi:hypothetical protein